MDLVIAEKDVLARDIARAMCGINVSDTDKGPFVGKGFKVCACSGHLLSLLEPAQIDKRYEKWQLDNLPILFKPWAKAPTNKYAKVRLDLIKKCLEECSGTIYHAGDADDEGQLIVDEVLEYLGYDPTNPRIKRVYVNDSVSKNIIKAFKCARPNSECVNDGKAALARSLADMCFGVSESRLASVRLGKKMPVGRVQTPTLGLVVERDLAREAHVERICYFLSIEGEEVTHKFKGDFKYKPDKSELEDGKHVLEKTVLTDHITKVIDKTLEATCSVELKHENVPLPYSMTTLVSDMSKRYSMTSGCVMDTTQALRDKYNAITYNRSSVCYLKEEHFIEAPLTAKKVMKNLGLNLELDFSKPSAAFNEKKLEGSAHHGIIPTEIDVDLDKLSDKERKVYEAISMRYLAQFMGQATYKEASLVIDSDECTPGSFVCVKRQGLSEGWQGIAPSSWKKVDVSSAKDVLPFEGSYQVKLQHPTITEGKTKPPAAFSDGTLMSAMANVAKYARDPKVKEILLKKDENSANEHGSIGTPATRSAIIDGLIEHGYLERKGKSLISTDRARKFYELIPSEIKGVDLTAKWWLIQEQIAKGNVDIYTIAEDVCSEFHKHKESAYVGKTLDEVVGRCPRCGADVVSRGKIYTCTTNKNEKDEQGSWHLVEGCGFKIVPFSGKHLTTKQAASLLSGKKVSCKGLKSKSGKKYDCDLVLDSQSDFGCHPEFPKTTPKKAKRSADLNGV